MKKPYTFTAAPIECLNGRTLTLSACAEYLGGDKYGISIGYALKQPDDNESPANLGVLISLGRAERRPFLMLIYTGKPSEAVFRRVLKYGEEDFLAMPGKYVPALRKELTTSLAV